MIRVVLRYLVAFAAAGMVPVIGVLAEGRLPGMATALQGLAAGLVGTGLFHVTPPRGD